MTRSSFNRETLLHQMSEEAHGVRFYQSLAGMTTDLEQVKQLEYIGQQEVKHLQMLMRIWHRLYRSEPSLEVEYTAPNNFLQGVNEALADEIVASEVYRDMYLDIGDSAIRESLFDAMTDETRHGQMLQKMQTDYLMNHTQSSCKDN